MCVSMCRVSTAFTTLLNSKGLFGIFRDNPKDWLRNFSSDAPNFMGSMSELLSCSPGNFKQRHMIQSL